MCFLTGFFFKELPHQEHWNHPPQWGKLLEEAGRRGLIVWDMLAHICTHVYVFAYTHTHLFFLEGPVPDAMLRTFSTALTHLNGIDDSTSSTTIIVIIIVIIYWYSERLNDSPKFTQLANGRAKGLNSDPPDSLTAYCLQWCVQVFYVLNLKDL